MKARFFFSVFPRLAVRLILLWGLLTVPTLLVAEGSPWEWEGVSRVIALGDVHGSYDKMVSLLKGTKLVDENLAWTGGNQHLVFCGDLTDRGSNDRHVMDLARRLQTEAEAAGGKVHVVLGNHDVMNLTRDRRYWNADLTDEFAEDETEQERKEGLNSFRNSQDALTAHDTGAFDERFPPGYFARAKAFELDGEYGSWLIEQPTVVKVNGVLFLHGGLTPTVAELGLDEINRQVTVNIRTFLAKADELGDAVPFPADFGMILHTASEIAEKGGRKAQAAVAEAVLEAHEGLAFAPAGPVWYRGTSVENERLETADVQAVLTALDARAEMVGHTVTRSGKISSRFDGKVYRADVGMGYGRPPLAAVIQGETLLVFNPADTTLTLAYTEPPQGEGWPAGEEDLSDHLLEKFLEKAPIKSQTPLTVDFQTQTGVEKLELVVLELEHKDMELRSLFGDADETAEEAAALGRKDRRSCRNQVAAYRLDRQFDLKMVPVTVFRKVDGRKGCTQIWMQGAWDVEQVVDQGIATEQLADLAAEVARGRAFTGLIGLIDRADFGKLILPVSRKVMLSDNGVAFSENTDVGTFVEEGCGPVGEAFKHSLGTLELGRLKKNLGDLLSDAQIEAILERRDGILELCADPDPDWSLEKLLEKERAQG